MNKINIKAFMIMSKDRTLIATGNPRNRTLTPIDDMRDGIRLLTYKSKGKATSAFTKHGFYGMKQLSPENPLEAVPVTITIQENIDDGDITPNQKKFLKEELKKAEESNNCLGFNKAKGDYTLNELKIEIEHIARNKIENQ